MPGGMDFGDFDFSNFDPSTMPQGGSFPGMGRRRRMIRLKHIYKSYPLGDTTVDVLKDVNLHVRPQEFVSILGPSGSGKSTLMNIIGCLDVADSGEYLLDGEYVDDCTEDQLSEIRGKKIGFIFSSSTSCRS